MSGSESSVIDIPFNIPLQRTTDKILTECFFKQFKSEDEEPFGHYGSNSFRLLFIQYIDPKPVL
ncbi:MAG: hypothetical protein R3321_07065 [Nitrososphaeraceae archaeon]|nr:hypothetical protein [Nitrososphaeraceae archaeon]